jgi:hypothetical protein
MKCNALSRTLCAVSITFTALLSGGCASIIHGGPRTISVTTQPPGAKATVAKDTGETVSVNTTPFTVTLEPKKGFFQGQPYNIKLELPGYKTVEVAVRPEISGWYVANLLFGGLPGLLIVDPATGAMWNLSPEKIEQQLSPTQAELIKSGRGFVVVLVSQITEKERAQMVRVN